MGSAQLAEQHGDELCPTGEAPGMALGTMIADGLLKFQARKELGA
jgi:hypothetical protein